jgi:alkylation response protein AidB-like acyl-CoA dehydrogenase
MNFFLDDDHRVLKDSAQVFLDEVISLKPLLVPGATVADARYAENWASIAAMGWAGLMIDPEFGGVGLGAVDLVMVVEELGRTLTPSPFLGVLLGALAVQRGGHPAQKSALLPAIAAGELRLALALAEPGGREEGPDRVTRAAKTSNGWRITGRKTLVLDAAGAAQIVTAAADENGVRRFFLVRSDQPGVTVTVEPWRDITRQVCSIDFQDAEAEPLGDQDEGLWPWLRDHALLALSAENAAGLRHVLDFTADYARQRVAFGRPIGAYQAIKHSLADMLGQAECARTATLYAAWTLAEGDDRAPLAAAMAKAYSSDAYVEAVHRSIQVFGAIGFTWEMPNHLYFKRAHGNAELFGSAGVHRARVIDLALAEAA